jgi:hypothetical protein
MFIEKITPVKTKRAFSRFFQGYVKSSIGFFSSKKLARFMHFLPSILVHLLIEQGLDSI